MQAGGKTSRIAISHPMIVYVCRRAAPTTVREKERARNQKVAVHHIGEAGHSLLRTPFHSPAGRSTPGLPR